MQTYSDISRLRQLMNAAGEKEEPFLFVLNFDLTEGLFIKDPLTSTEILFSIKGVGNDSPKVQEGSPEAAHEKICGEKAVECHTNAEGETAPRWKAFPESEEEYSRKFQIVQKGIRHGDSFLLNLTTRTPIDCDLSLEEIYHRSPAPYKICVPDHFVCFSPEAFITITEDGTISSYPMKGTIDATLPDAEALLMADEKEKQEHYTICDLIRNDLNSIARNVHIQRFRYCEKIRTATGAILQTSSEIQGELESDWKAHIGDHLIALLPAGSISGAPKKASVDLIHQAESHDRGYYTGVFGYYDGHSLQSAVLIRFIGTSQEATPQKYYYSGGGITLHSRSTDEYHEVIQKVYLPQATPFIETLKVEHGHICRVTDHIRRIRETLRSQNLRSAERYFQDLFHALEHDDFPALNSESPVFRMSIEYSYRPLSIRLLEYGFKPLKTFQTVYADDIDYSLKYADRSALEKLYAQRGEKDEIIIIRDGHVTDCSIGNLVFEKAGKYYTPNTYLLNGLMRQQLLQEGKILETEIKDSGIVNFDKIIVINSMRSL